MNTGYATFADAPRLRHRAPSGVAHAAVALCAWGIAAVVTLAIAGETKIGPVVYTLTKNHGLHAGDVATFLLMSVFAMVVTIAVSVSYWSANRRYRQRHQHRY